MNKIGALCLLVALSGVLPAQALKYVVTVQVNVQSGTASCNDWFFGIGGSTPANQQFLAALATYNIGATPSVSCRMEANTVHSMELVTAEPGANALFDDARKVSEAVAQLRNLSVTNRVSLWVNFYYTVPNVEASQAVWDTLNKNIRSGDFMGKVANAATPLLTAVAYQETFDNGVAC